MNSSVCSEECGSLEFLLRPHIVVDGCSEALSCAGENLVKIESICYDRSWWQTLKSLRMIHLHMREASKNRSITLLESISTNAL
ncbi:hypothetical protein Q3G72_034576 [Acer saccharum]|nr:hypothetical protein Q3G72_034576 [Acer saccharum]